MRRRTGRARIEALNEASHESNPVRYGGPLIQASVRLVRSNGEAQARRARLCKRGYPGMRSNDGATPGALG